MLSFLAHNQQQFVDHLVQLFVHKPSYFTLTWLKKTLLTFVF